MSGKAMAKTDPKNEEDITHPPNTFSSYAIIILVLTAFLVLVFVARAHLKEQDAARILTLNQKQHTSYQDILREMHTGVRLARWRDFIQHEPDSKYTQAARLHASALTVHEQAAWAHYSEHVFTMPIDVDEIAYARLLYLNDWGNLLRADKLSRLEKVTSSNQLSLKAAKSIYRKGKINETLTGGPRGKRVRAVRYERNKPSPKYTRTTSREIKIKTARKPNYPRAAKRRKINAEVVLSLNIDDRGRVVVTKLVSVEAKRYRSDFVRAAKRAARRSRFYPQIVDGLPVNTSNYKRTYTFIARD